MKLDIHKTKPPAIQKKEGASGKGIKFSYYAKRYKKIWINAGIIFIFIIASFILPVFLPYNYSEQIPGASNLTPSIKHIMGTDTLGRDVFVRVLYGIRISISIAVTATLFSLTIGVFYGAISGYSGAKADNIMMRILDIIDAVPQVLYAILLSVVFKSRSYDNSALHGLDPGLLSIFITLCLINWITMARIIRGQVLSIKRKEFIMASQLFGTKYLHILTKHIIPNCIGAMVVTVALKIPSAIFTEAFLSFIGIGVEPPLPSLGKLVYDGIGEIRSYPHLLIFPAVSISVIIFVFTLLGEGFRELFDKNKEMITEFK
jgi:oligopeptide transport system permease protein